MAFCKDSLGRAPQAFQIQKKVVSQKGWGNKSRKCWVLLSLTGKVVRLTVTLKPVKCLVLVLC